MQKKGLPIEVDSHIIYTKKNNNEFHEMNHAPTDDFPQSL